ncbi:MAG TPA: malto-oligosyltrehalose synthase, partial [Candidatus Dormibacteraeota bacterium]|nr:malto-oligosyltrehalose synthase [Candidatus Dormibacteraeota bacterium]
MSKVRHNQREADGLRRNSFLRGKSQFGFRMGHTEHDSLSPSDGDRARVRSHLNRLPVATYRLQFNREFGFKQATELLDYLHELGITDCYASPVFKAGNASTHGYDVCDFNRLNPNLGTQQEFYTFTKRLRSLGMGLLLDMVPNHMRADCGNEWWLDVLENGPASKYADWFDIDWGAPAVEGKVLLPVLEDHYEKVLEAGKLNLVFEQGKFRLAYYNLRYPVSPDSVKRLAAMARRQGANHVLKQLNGRAGFPASFDQLNALLQQQHYRLTYWKSGEINYRRFFDVTELVSLRMENPRVFDATHKLLFKLAAEGKVTGLRIDHPDGLLDPKQYFQRLQHSLATRTREFYVVAEKILTGDEALPDDWPVQGTTGYDFLNRVTGVFVNQNNEKALDAIYREFSGCKERFQSVVDASKRYVLTHSFNSELDALALRLKELSQQTGFGRDFSTRQLREALLECVVRYPVYRTYIDGNGSVARKRQRTGAVQDLADTRGRPGSRDSVLDCASPLALSAPSANPQTSDSPAFRFTKQLLCLQPPHGVDRAAAKNFVMRLQQFTGPVMAKGLEDTAFYRYARLLSLNDVGGAPDKFGTSVAKFHKYNLQKMRAWPHALLATATHDTKRGEDARARLDVLSELPGEWLRAVTSWGSLNAENKTIVDDQPAPS